MGNQSVSYAESVGFGKKCSVALTRICVQKMYFPHLLLVDAPKVTVVECIDYIALTKESHK